MSIIFLKIRVWLCAIGLNIRELNFIDTKKFKRCNHNSFHNITSGANDYIRYRSRYDTD